MSTSASASYSSLQWREGAVEATMASAVQEELHIAAGLRRTWLRGHSAATNTARTRSRKNCQDEQPRDQTWSRVRSTETGPPQYCLKLAPERARTAWLVSPRSSVSCAAASEDRTPAPPDRPLGAARGEEEVLRISVASTVENSINGGVSIAAW